MDAVLYAMLKNKITETTYDDTEVRQELLKVAENATDMNSSIAQNTNNIEKKLDKNQGASNSGKITGINESGDIVPMFPQGVTYNEDTQCLEYGADEKLNLNAGIQLDDTLSKVGYAADAASVGELKSDLDRIPLITSNMMAYYDDLIIQDSYGLINDITNGMFNIALPVGGTPEKKNIFIWTKTTYPAGTYTIHLKNINIEAWALPAMNISIFFRVNGVNKTAERKYFTKDGVFDGVNKYTLQMASNEPFQLGLLIWGEQWSDKNWYFEIVASNSENYDEKLTNSFVPSHRISLRNNVSDNVYYFSSAVGDDENDGYSEHSPKKNPEPYIEKGNCTVLLRSGDEFRTELRCGSNLKISSYGGVEKPKVCGLRKIETPFSYTENIYEVYIGVDDIGIIRINGNDYWSRTDITMPTKKDEYYYDRESKKLYFYGDNPNGKNVEYSAACSGIYVPSDKENVVIDGIGVSYFGLHGIAVSNNVSNVIIVNNEVENIGNSFLNNTRLGNGIQVWAQNVQNILIKNNIVRNCFDAGISPQVSTNTSAHTINSENIRFEHNYVANCFYPVECFLHQSSKAIRNIHISNNFIENCTDITNGYRGNANHSFCALLMLWTINGAEENEVFVENNVCIGSDSFAIAFFDTSSEKQHDSGNQYIIKNNVLVTTLNQITDYYTGNNGKQIKNEEAYHGNDTFVVLSNDLDISDKTNIAYYSSLGQKLLFN